MTNGVKKVPSSTIKGTSDSAIKKVQKRFTYKSKYVKVVNISSVNRINLQVQNIIGSPKLSSKCKY